MKIAFVTASVSRNAGGLHESVRRLAQSMAGSAAHIRVFALNDEHTSSDKASWDPLEVSTFPVTGPRQFGFAPGLARALLDSGARLVMSHGLWMYPSIATAQWHRRTGGPYVVHPHGMLDPWAVRNSAWKKRLADRFYERRHLEGAACIRALCESEARAIRDYGLKNPIAIIPNGIDTVEMGNADCGLRNEDAAAAAQSSVARGPWSVVSSQQSEVSSQWSVVSGQRSAVSGLKSDGRKALLYLGRIHPKKGLPNLLRTWANLSTPHSEFRIPNSGVPIPKSAIRNPQSNGWVLAIAGWDQAGHEAELKRLATELGLPWSDLRDRGLDHSAFCTLHSALVFLGPQFGPDKTACYRDCDAFILPSFSEGLPMVVLEAWAHGKPVLMTPECNLPEGFAANAAIPLAQAPSVSGPWSVVSSPRSMVSGQWSVVSGQSTKGIEEGLRELLAMDDASRLAMGARGRALVAERFAWPKIALEMQAVYQWILGNGPRPACVLAQ